MKILFTCIEEPSHLRTMVPLAWGMLAAGHEVRVAGGPTLIDMIVRAGLPAVEVGAQAQASAVLSSLTAEAGDGDFENVLTDWTRPFDPTTTWEESLLRYQVAVPMAFALYNDPLVDDLVDLCRDWRPDLLLWEPLTYAGPIAAAASGVAQARVNWMHDIYGAGRESFVRLRDQQPEEDQEDPLREWFESHLDHYDADFDESLVSGLWTYDLVPPSQQFETGHVRAPYRPLPYSGAAIMPQDLPEPGWLPRVCLTSGTSFKATFGREFIDVAAMVEALADLDVEVVAAIPPERAAELTVRPDNLVRAGYVPLPFLLPTCSALLHHGGFGSWAAALMAGIPQHITSLKHGDMSIKGDHLVASSAGLFRHVGELTPEQLRADVLALVNDARYADGARALREQALALPSPAEIALGVPTLLDQHA